MKRPVEELDALARAAGALIKPVDEKCMLTSVVVAVPAPVSLGLGANPPATLHCENCEAATHTQRSEMPIDT